MNSYKIIPSRTIARYAEKIGHNFSDRDFASIIYNLDVNMEERNEYLEELVKETDDEDLKRKILDKIAYEEKAISLFEDNTNASEPCIYVLHITSKNNSYTKGYFQNIELAKKLAIEENYTFTIEKYRIYCDENLEKFTCWSYPEYPISAADYDKNGVICHIQTKEMKSKNENQDLIRTYFEYDFINIPNPFERGEEVRCTLDNRTGRISTSQSEWNEFIEKITREGKKVSWSSNDISVNFYYQSNPEKVNPIFLERLN